MLLSTCNAFWEPVRDSLLPLVAGLGLTINVWVASRLRSTSEVVRSTSQATEATLVAAHQLLGRSVSPHDARDLKK